METTLINKIYNDDCIKGMSKLDENSIDLIITSPPYYNAREYSQYASYEEFLQFLRTVFERCLYILKENRMCCVNISTILVPRDGRESVSKRIAIPFHFVNLMEDIGFIFLEDIIWTKPEGSAKNRNGNFFQIRKPLTYKPNIVNEYIFVFKKPSEYLVDKVIKSYDNEIIEKSLIKDGYERSNVWHIHPETKSFHSAPYPVELSDKLVEYYSYVDDIVLDPFIGSGTTAISCIKNNRNFVGYELDKNYFELTENRIKKEIRSSLTLFSES